MNRAEKEGKLFKIEFYFMSLWLLFLLIFIITFDISGCFEKGARFIGWLPLLKRNWIAFPALLFSLASWLLAWHNEHEWKGVSNPPYRILSIKNENFEYLTFLTTYIIPLICMDFTNWRYVLVLVILLAFVGYVFVKMDLYYGNPTLLCMKYKLYRVKIDSPNITEDVILISKDNLIESSSFTWIPIDKNVWIAKEI